MIRTTLRAVLCAAIVVSLLAATAQAQGVREIPRGGGFTVENTTECAPNADVVVSYSQPGESPRRIGASLSDSKGHFSVDVALPLSAEVGAAVVTVQCGIEGGVLLYDVIVVEAVSTDFFSYAPYVAGVVGALLLLGLLGSRSRRRRSRAEKPEQVEPTAPVSPAGAAAMQPEDEDEDGADYWFWDTTTEHGPVKRLACLTDERFYLHEVPVEAFNPLLELLATAGPDTALHSAFFNVGVADIDEIRYRRTEMQLTYLSEGEFVTRTIDLATEVDGVIDLLSRRVPVTEAVEPADSR